MIIPFPKRELVVAQVQRALKLPETGRDTTSVWLAIAQALPLVPLPAVPAIETEDFPNRRIIVSRVQRVLGIPVDGSDGKGTWSALAERFDPPRREVLSSEALPHSGRYVERSRGRTPNRNKGANERLGLVLHHACGYFEGTVSWCLQDGTQAGYHVLIALNGERALLALETDRAHHAGKSRFKGREGCNAFMLGLAFTGDTNNGARRGAAGPALTPDEVASAVEWIKPRMLRYGWFKNDITTHAAVSPGRKDDVSPAAYRQIIDALG